MTHPSPLLDLHRDAQAELVGYGPASDPILVPADFGAHEIEYAAIRKGAAVVDWPQRAVLEVKGPDRLEFLNRMLTQDLRGLSPGRCTRSFWLNKKGRIDADLRLIELGDRTLLELDVLAAQRTFEGLGRYIIMEDVTLAEVTGETHRIGLHGPHALRTLTGAESLAPGASMLLTVAGHAVLVYREDSTGETGLELLVPAAAALDVYRHMLAAGASAIGWHAWNTARIEAGTPLYNIDFGEESLPAETGVLDDRVSFTKGCYLGQEIVARLHARGQPKQVVVGVRFESLTQDGSPLAIQPPGGSVLALESAPETPIGVVTSSTLAPMLGSSPIALASIRYAHAADDTAVVTSVDGRTVRGSVQRSLRIWPGP